MGEGKSGLVNWFRLWYKQHRKKHELFDNLHREYHEKHEEYHKKTRELAELRMELRRKKRELKHFGIIMKYLRPVALIFNLLIWYFVFKYGGSRLISIVFAVMMTIGWIAQLIFHWRLEKRVIKPLARLKDGVEEIARGNYDVEVKNEDLNEINSLIDSFNDMAKKLLEGEKLKAEYEENRKNLIANISHDLKTPVTSIQGYIEAIIEGNVSSPEIMKKYLKTIYNNSAYITRLIDDLFLFSKLDMQKLEFEFVEIKAKSFVGDLMEEFILEFEDKDTTFLYNDYIENDCYLRVDRKRIHQVLRNIIGNAEKYGSELNLTITSELYIKEGSVCISITDNGPGIPEDKLSHIFERFYRIDTQRTKDLMSTGLGLAISKELVEAHGGEIGVTSKESEGTCFTIKLPVIS